MKYILRTAISMCFVALVFTACDGDSYSKEMGLYAYISETAAGKSAAPVSLADNKISTQLTVCLSEKSDKDQSFRFVLDQAVLNAYNSKESSSYALMPEQLVEMPEEFVIPAGKYNSDPIHIDILPLGDFESTSNLAMALRLEAVRSDAKITPTTSTYVQPANITLTMSLPVWNGGTGLTANGFPKTLDNFTVEMRFQVQNTGNRNRSLFNNGGSVLLRFEDPNSYSPDHPLHSLVQFQGSGWYLNPTTHFEVNKWQHLAFVWDGTKVIMYVNGANAGQLEGTLDTNFGSANWFGDATGDTWWGSCKIIATEMRIWNIVRTAAQIQNNITNVGAKSPGLVAYWSLDEATYDDVAKTYEDLTGNGNYLQTTKSPIGFTSVKTTDTATAWL